MVWVPSLRGVFRNGLASGLTAPPTAFETGASALLMLALPVSVLGTAFFAVFALGRSSLFAAPVASSCVPAYEAFGVPFGNGFFVPIGVRAVADFATGAFFTGVTALSAVFSPLSTVLVSFAGVFFVAEGRGFLVPMGVLALGVAVNSDAPVSAFLVTDGIGFFVPIGVLAVAGLDVGVDSVDLTAGVLAVLAVLSTFTGVFFTGGTFLVSDGLEVVVFDAFFGVCLVASATFAILLMLAVLI